MQRVMKLSLPFRTRNLLWSLVPLSLVPATTPGCGGDTEPEGPKQDAAPTEDAAPGEDGDIDSGAPDAPIDQATYPDVVYYGPPSY